MFSLAKLNNNMLKMWSLLQTGARLEVSDSKDGSLLWSGHYQAEFDSGINNFLSFFVSLFNFQTNQTSVCAGEMGYFFELCLIL